MTIPEQSVECSAGTPAVTWEGTMRLKTLILMLLAAATAIPAAAPAGSARKGASSCQQWVLSGTWATVQSNNYHTAFEFTQNGTEVKAVASVSLAEMRAGGMTSPTWEVSGTLIGDELVLRGVQPPRTNGAVYTGAYRATVSDGELKGTAENVTVGQTVTWTGKGTTSCAGGAAAAAGTALATTGNVQFQVPGAGFAPLKPGTALPPGTTVHTGYGATAMLNVPGQGTITLGPLSQITIGKNDIYQLHVGTVDVNVKRPGRQTSDFEVHSPIAAASDRGTKFSVTYKSGVMTVKVTKDTVWVTPTNRKLKRAVVKAGYQVVVTKTKIGPVRKT
jgi:hypothetical protein